MYSLYKKDIKKIDLSPVFNLLPVKANKYLHKDREHYKLLHYISNWFEGETLLDIGTFLGASALSLALNKKNTVYTIDYKQKFKAKKFHPYPVIPIAYDATSLDENEKFQELVSKSKFILLDITHNGKDEMKFYKALCDLKWTGVLLLDDIYLKRLGNMKKFWESIEETKYDLTDVGHWSGSGLVDFSNQIKII